MLQGVQKFAAMAPLRLQNFEKSLQVTIAHNKHASGKHFKAQHNILMVPQKMQVNVQLVGLKKTATL